LDDAKGLFEIKDNRDRFSRKAALSSTAKGWMKKLVPNISANVSAQKNYQKISGLLTSMRDDPFVLVIGGATRGVGIQKLKQDSRIELLETDVAIGLITQLVCDAHQLPFEDGTFDCVVIQAVLEYLQDPQRCVEEIYRVLRPEGIVYSEAPFMQPVHGGQIDFTRFTQVGHRRLYRRFAEISSGVCVGPGSALACSIQYFFLSFVTSAVGRDLLKAAARFGLFWLKYLDYFLADSKGAVDGASGTFFMGRKSALTLSDKDVVAAYKGAMTSNGIF
jgi:SAM-dependent methyltransferase